MTFEHEIYDLFDTLISAWNSHDAQGYADLFDEEGVIIGFDGTAIDGRTAIQSEVHDTFSEPTPTFVSVIQDVRFPSPDTALLRAAVGVVMPGASDIHPPANAVQSMMAKKRDHTWRIVLLQLTPAAFHGRPDAVEALNTELRKQLHSSP